METKKNRISVIMGVYNSRPEYLKLAIESILNQTYSEFDFIICDDCSTNEETIKILLKYEDVDSRIKILRNSKNSGLAASLNYCLKYATGKYVARMDDDDISHLDRFEKQVAFLDEHPEISIVGTGITFIDDSGNVWGKTNNIECPTKRSFLYGTPFTHPTIMVRKETYQAVDGYKSDKHTKRTEDYDMFMRMYAKGFKGYNLQENLFDYRMDISGYRKQKLKYRVDEVVIKYRGFKLLGLFPEGTLYLIKPIISGLIPNELKYKRDRKRFK